MILERGLFWHLEMTSELPKAKIVRLDGGVGHSVLPGLAGSSQKQHLLSGLGKRQEWEEQQGLV